MIVIQKKAMLRNSLAGVYKSYLAIDTALH